MNIYIYIYSPAVSADSGRGEAEHTALHVSMFQRDPNSPSSFKLAPSPSSAVSNGRIWLSCAGPGAPETDWGRCLSLWIGLLEPFPSALRWPVGMCFSGAHVWNQIHPFHGVWEGGRMEGEMKGEWKKRKTKNYLCLSAIT